jgi:glycosyltransferase involved in cell wall biosynthesis
MKIAWVVPGGMDASETFRVIPVLLWLLGRIARAHELHVFALAGADRAHTYHLRGATIHAMGAGARSARALASLLREHRRRAFDVLHAFWAVPCGIVAAAAGVLTRRPVLTHLAGGELASFPALDYGVCRTARGRVRLRAALRGATRITAASAPMIAAAAAHGFAAQRVPLGVDREAWPVVAPRPRPTGRPARLIHVASLSPVKDQTTLLRAAAILARDNTAFTLDIVGEDTLNGGVQQCAEHEGVAAQTRFHGFLPQQELRPILAAADLLVVSSRHEAGPIVLLEAAACGVPTVGTAVGHLAEWAPAAACAVPPADPAALAEGIASLLQDDATRVHMACNAQQRALTEDADYSARCFLDLYTDLGKRR